MGDSGDEGLGHGLGSEGELSGPWVREEAVPWVLPAEGWGVGRHWAGYGE